jgi:hypothetical protein
MDIRLRAVEFLVGMNDHDDEDKEILILSSHMDRKSVWEDIMKEKEDRQYS